VKPITGSDVGDGEDRDSTGDLEVVLAHLERWTGSGADAANTGGESIQSTPSSRIVHGEARRVVMVSGLRLALKGIGLGEPG
jgi:hypothetical protein